MLLLHVLVRGLALFVLGELTYSIPSINLDPAPASFPILQVARIGAGVFLAIAFVLLMYPWRGRALSILMPPLVGAAYLGLLLAINALNHHAISSGVVPANFKFGGGIFEPDRLRIPGVLQRIGVCYAIAGSLALFLRLRGLSVAT